MDAWQLAEKKVKELPPYLKDDELTVVRFYEKHKDEISEGEAREILDEFVQAGVMRKEERRYKNKKPGSRPVVYIAVEKGKA